MSSTPHIIAHPTKLHGNGTLSTNDDTFEEADFSGFLSRYEGFGSFFSEDVEVLIRKPEGEYTAPEYPAFASLASCLAATVDNKTENNKQGIDNNNIATPSTLPPPAPFGKAFRDAYFAISNDFTFINHGAFGGALKIGTHLKQQFEHLMEHQLLCYMDRLVLPWIVHCTRAIAHTVIKCNPTDLVLVPNATYGINTAIANLVNHGDVVVFFETEYLAVFKMIVERCESLLAASIQSGGALAPAALKELPLDGLLLDEAIMGNNERLAAHIAEHLPLDTTVIVMDLITSTASLHLPVFTHIIPALRKRLPKLRHIIVDGAHGPLQCEVNMDALTPEQLPSVYVGNLHKWFSAPKSVGVMWVREDLQEEIRPLIVSHGAKNGFLSDFVWDGTRDHGAVLALPTIIDFWYNYIGVDKVRAYCHNLQKEATAMLTAAWRSEVQIPRGAPFMSLVMLPPFFQKHSRFITAKYLQDTLHTKHAIEVPVKIIRGNLFVRVSFFVNNEMGDFERLRDAVLAIEKDIIVSLKTTRAARLAKEEQFIITIDDNANQLGQKRSRSAESQNTQGGELLDAETQRRLQQQHHDKSQIVRRSPVGMGTSKNHTNPLSATSTVAPFSPAVLDVPLNVPARLQAQAGVAQVIVKATHKENTQNGTSSDVTKNSTLNNNFGPRPTISSLGLAPAPVSSEVDPNCNGCGLGALGAAPKKSRKFAKKVAN